MKNLYLKNPWFVFAPFLVVYLFMIYKLNCAVPIVFMGDEPRYLEYADHILNGYFSPKGKVDLWSGPGYPLLIAAFFKVGFNVIGLRLLNAVLQYLSIIILFKTLQFWTSHKKAFWFSVAWACYYIAFKEMLYVYTEPLTSLLVVLIAFCISKSKVSNSTSTFPYFHLVLAGILLGYLALVKIIFGYVILFCLLVFLFIYLFKRKKEYAQLAMVFAIAIIATAPYLKYTYQITGRYFYWGNSGGMSLYWMSTPFENEYGDWNDAKFRAYCDYDTTMPCNAHLFAKNHQADYDTIYQLDGVARDDAFKRKAIENIKTYPIKYLKNMLANGSRLFFSIPNSYQPIKKQNIFRIIPNIFVLILFMYCLFISIRKSKYVSASLFFMLIILISYLGATLLVSAQQRQLYVVLPLIIILFAALTNRRRLFVESN